MESEDIPLSGNYYPDIQILSELDVKSLRNICSIENHYIRDLCNSRDLWDPKFRALGRETPNESYPQILDTYIISKEILRPAEHGDRYGYYWPATNPNIRLNLRGATRRANRFGDQPENNRFVYWPAYRVAGLVDDILDKFHIVSYVTVDGQVLPLTRETIINTSIDPLTEEGMEIIRNLPPSIKKSAVKYENLVIGSPIEVANPDDIVIPLNHIRLNLDVRQGLNLEKYSFDLTSSSPDGFTRQDLANQIINISQTFDLQYLQGANVVDISPHEEGIITVSIWL